MRKLFLDTGYLIALEAADDQHHKLASAHWESLSRSLPLLVTTSYVFDEVVTFFNSRNRHAKAVEIGRLLLESPSVKLMHIDEPLFLEAWRYFIQHRFPRTFKRHSGIRFWAEGSLEFEREVGATEPRE